MSIIDFIFALFGGRFTLTPDEFDQLREKINSDIQESNHKIVGFLKSPYLLLLLPIILPFAKRALDNLWAKLAPDADGDGDNDLADLLAQLSEKLQQKRLQQ